MWRRSSQQSVAIFLWRILNSEIPNAYCTKKRYVQCTLYMSAYILEIWWYWQCAVYTKKALWSLIFHDFFEYAHQHIFKNNIGSVPFTQKNLVIIYFSRLFSIWGPSAPVAAAPLRRVLLLRLCHGLPWILRADRGPALDPLATSWFPPTIQINVQKILAITQYSASWAQN